MRSASAAVLLVLLAWLVVAEPVGNDVSAIGTILGSLLVILGFAGRRR